MLGPLKLWFRHDHCVSSIDRCNLLSSSKIDHSVIWFSNFKLNLDRPTDYHPRVVAMTKHSVRIPTVHPSTIRKFDSEYLTTTGWGGRKKEKGCIVWSWHRMTVLLVLVLHNIDLVEKQGNTKQLTPISSNSLLLCVTSKGVAGRKSRIRHRGPCRKLIFYWPWWKWV